MPNIFNGPGVIHHSQLRLQWGPYIVMGFRQTGQPGKVIGYFKPTDPGRWLCSEIDCTNDTDKPNRAGQCEAHNGG